MLATCPEARLRDGSKAVASATRACELTQWKVAHPMAALAAAYAEKGDFKSAMKWQQKAIELSPENDPASRTYRIGSRTLSLPEALPPAGVLEEWGIRKYQPVVQAQRGPLGSQGERNDLESAITDGVNAIDALQDVDDRRQLRIGRAGQGDLDLPIAEPLAGPDA